MNKIRSLGLHEQRKIKKDNQIHQHLSVQELCIQNESCNTECNLKPVKPVFNVPVASVDTSIICKNCQNIVELDIHVATPVVTLDSQMDVITIHNTCGTEMLPLLFMLPLLETL